MSVWRKMFDLLVVIIILILPHTGIFANFSYSIPILLLVWGALRINKKGFTAIGFSFSELTLKRFGVGILAGVGVFALLQIVFWPTVQLFYELNGEEPELYAFLKKDVFSFVFILIMGWLIGGMYETIVFHGYMYDVIKEQISSTNATCLSFIITSVLFGAYHYQLGMVGTINALLAGMLYLGLSIKFKGNLWPTIICHGVYNNFVIVSLYMDWL